MSIESTAARTRSVLALLDEIHDPCGAAAGHSIGLVSMGVVESVAIEDGDVRVRILPTFPGCLYVGMFEQEARRRIERLDWCESFSVERASVAAGVWSEERMDPEARERLAAARTERPGNRARA